MDYQRVGVCVCLCWYLVQMGLVCMSLFVSIHTVLSPRTHTHTHTHTLICHVLRLVLLLVARRRVVVVLITDGDGPTSCEEQTV